MVRTVPPLVVTLALDDDSQRRFDVERVRWFPAGRTQVGAHLTLFHSLPGNERQAVLRDLGRAAAGSGFAVPVTGVISLGGGAAYELRSAPLQSLHRMLQQQWQAWLTRQDSQPLRPHVTVQNKVSPALARETVTALRAAFEPFEVQARGFDLWRYDGGPWTMLEHVGFRRPPRL